MIVVNVSTFRQELELAIDVEQNAATVRDTWTTRQTLAQRVLDARQKAADPVCCCCCCCCCLFVVCFGLYVGISLFVVC
jgi:hypothetical protein